MLPRGMLGEAKQVLTLATTGLEGRGLAVHVSRHLYDVCFVTVYCPLGDKEVQNNKKTEQLWQWVARIREVLPARTHLILGVDANGHVGSVHEYTTEDPHSNRAGRREEHPHVGPYGADPENTNGTYMREFLETADMVAVNTWDE